MVTSTVPCAWPGPARRRRLRHGRRLPRSDPSQRARRPSGVFAESASGDHRKLAFGAHFVLLWTAVINLDRLPSFGGGVLLFACIV